MNQKNNFPTYYFLILLLAFLLSILFWFYVIQNPNRTSNVSNNYIVEKEYWEKEYLPDEIGKIIPIDTTKIIIDSTSNKKIIADIVNIALKQNTGSIAKFASDFKGIYNSNDFKIVYIDSVVNRLQVQLPQDKRVAFKKEVKQKLSNYKLLVWDEALFGFSKTFNDPYYASNNKLWYLDNINIQNAWKVTTGNKNVTIAVIDNGFDIRHPELNNKIVKPYNVIEKSTNVQPTSQNHGTHVASTILAKGNNNEGIVGICPDCNLMPIKIADQNEQMSSSYIIDAILYAIKNKADVINLSLGLQIPFGTTIPTEIQKEMIKSEALDEQEFWNDLFTYAAEQNTICVLAAGNSNVLTGIDPFQRSNKTIKVGAINSNNFKANFSNFGNFTTIYAPGTNILGAKPNNKYEELQGTSMAAPIISGIVGLLKSKNQKITFEEVLNFLETNSEKINNINKIKLQNFN